MRISPLNHRGEAGWYLDRCLELGVFEGTAELCKAAKYPGTINLESKSKREPLDGIQSRTLGRAKGDYSSNGSARDSLISGSRPRG